MKQMYLTKCGGFAVCKNLYFYISTELKIYGIASFAKCKNFAYFVKYILLRDVF